MATTPFPTGGYTPNSADSSQPTEDKLVVTAAAEFRGIKRRLNQTIPPGGGIGIPPGGLKGEVLTKLSEGDYDAAWVSLGDIVGEDGESVLFPNYFHVAGSANRSTPGAFQNYALVFGTVDFDGPAGFFTIPVKGLYIFDATFQITVPVAVTVPTVHSVGVEVYGSDGTVYGTFVTEMTVHPGVQGASYVIKRMGYTGILEAGLRVRCVHVTPLAGQAGNYSPISVRQFTGVHIEKGGIAGGGGSSGSEIVQVACSDLTTPLQALEYAGFFAAANPMSLTSVRADLRTPSSGGDVELRIRRGFPAADLLVEYLVIPEGERGASTSVLQGTAEALETGAPIYIDIMTPGTGATGLLVSFSTARDDVTTEPPAPSPAPPPDPSPVTPLAQAIEYIKTNPQLFYKGEVVQNTGNKIARGNVALAEDGIGTLHYVDYAFALTGAPLASTTTTAFFLPFACDPDGEIGRWGFADSGAAPKFLVNSLALDADTAADVKEAFPRTNDEDSGIKFPDEIWGRNYGPQQREIYRATSTLDVKGVTTLRHYHQGRNTSTDAPTALVLPFTWSKVDDSGAIPFITEGGLNIIDVTTSDFDVQVGDLVIAWTVLAKHPVDAVPVLDADLVYSWTRQRSNADGQNFYGMSIWFAKSAASYSISRAKTEYPGSRFVVYRKTAN